MNDNVQASLRIIDDPLVFDEKNHAWDLENVLTPGTLVRCECLLVCSTLLSLHGTGSENYMLQLRHAECQLQCDDHGSNNGQELWRGL